MKWSSQFTNCYAASGFVHLVVLVAAHSWWSSAPRVWPARAGVNSVAAVASREQLMIDAPVPAESEERPLESAVQFAAAENREDRELEIPEQDWPRPHELRERLPLHGELPPLESQSLAPTAADIPGSVSRAASANDVAPEQPPLARPYTAKRSPSTAAASVGSRVSLESMFSAGELRKSVPQPIDNPPPEYPPELLAAGREGVVLLRIKIAADGAVADCWVDRSSGERAFDEAAVRAARRWRFEPAMRFGSAVATEILFPIRFEYFPAP